jgi:hypothetical protein
MVSSADTSLVGGGPRQHLFRAKLSAQEALRLGAAPQTQQELRVMIKMLPLRDFEPRRLRMRLAVERVSASGASDRERSSSLITDLSDSRCPGLIATPIFRVFDPPQRFRNLCSCLGRLPPSHCTFTAVRYVQQAIATLSQRRDPHHFVEVEGLLVPRRDCGKHVYGQVPPMLRQPTVDRVSS